mgnify:CR=1 FL=1
MALMRTRSSRGSPPPPAPVLAKSGSNGRRPVTLGEHTAHVVEAFVSLFGEPDRLTSLAERWVSFFRLDPSHAADFVRHGIVASFCHDWGKANVGFQEMLSNPGNLQLLWHEEVSVLLLAQESVRRWLASNSLDVPLIMAAVLGHHLRARETTFGEHRGGLDPLVLNWDNPDLHRDLTEIARRLGLTTPIPETVPRRWSFHDKPATEDLQQALDDIRDQLWLFDRELRTDSKRRRMLWAVRASVVAADAAGSALPREGKGIGEWIYEAFFTARTATDTPDGCLTADTIRQAIILPRLEQIGIDESRLNPFQKACGDPGQVPPRALLLAPCGSGKTLAAWQWIAARCEEKPRRRVIFLYPTRASATEGYRDYIAYAGPEEAALVHGTADLDLDGIHPDLPTEARIDEARLSALRQWPKRLFSATVDQFLGYLQHGYGPTCHLPLLADSVVVFDEVHSYDRGAFSALLEFLRHFDVPVLCMTATMLEGRRKKLEELGLKYVNGLDFSSPGGESALRQTAQYPRYRVKRVEGREEAEWAVRQALRENKRVLWVVNTVERCQQIARDLACDPDADQLETEDGIPLFCYHSRYRLIDRKRWHEAVIDAFKARGDHSARQAVLAVTTQVCEMSLDLDADVLVTEWCPAPALIQRMGRCCRDNTAHETGRTGEVLIYEVPGDAGRSRHLPYTEAEMTAAAPLVAAIVAEGAVSQLRLQELLDCVDTPVELPKACRFIESGPWAASGEEQFRDITELNCPAILPQDIAEYARLRDPKKRGGDPPWKASELVLSIPKKHGQPHGRHDLPPWLRVATGGVYHPALGYCLSDNPRVPLIV